MTPETEHMLNEHIANPAGVMGLRVDEIFRFAYPETGESPSEAARRVLAATHFQGPVPKPAAAPPATSAPSEKDLERLMAKTLRRFFAEMAKIELE